MEKDIRKGRKMYEITGSRLPEDLVIECDQCGHAYPSGPGWNLMFELSTDEGGLDLCKNCAEKYVTENRQ